MIALLLTAGLALSPLPCETLAVPQAQAPLTVSKLKDEIDLSLRWLRSQQAEDGSYGDLPSTLVVLTAYAESPRAYRPLDGPYVARGLEWLLARQATDGSFHPEAVEDERSKRIWTGQVLAALELLGGESATESATRARTFLGEYEQPLTGERLFGHLSYDQLLDRAARLLLTREDEGFWGGPNGRVLTTGGDVLVLSRYYALAKKKAPAQESGAEASPLPVFDPADRARTEKSLTRGAEFLLSTRTEEGLWGFEGRADPGITAIVVGALLATPEPRPEAVTDAVGVALDWLLSLQKEDGSIHAGQLANYVTSASIMALSRAGRGSDAAAIERAKGFLQVLQADEGEGYGPDDLYYGGVGYGGDERPDLSNMQMALEALNASGLAPQDETFQKAIAFLERCQNRSESNDVAVVRDGSTAISGNDGGAGYAPGESKAGFAVLADGRKVPRSYGSMTYALLKGYLFAGLPKDDARVQAAWEWLQKNYTLDINPGFEASANPTDAYQGLFYYFFTMAKALDLYGDETIVDARGQAHAWRSELAGRLTSMQRQDGSWINANAARWYEGNPVLATAYAMVTLGTALPGE